MPVAVFIAGMWGIVASVFSVVVQLQVLLKQVPRYMHAVAVTDFMPSVRSSSLYDVFA